MKAKKQTSIQFTPALFDTYHKDQYIYTAVFELIITLASQIEENYDFVIEDISQALYFCNETDVISQLKESKECLLSYIKLQQTKFLKGEY